MARPKLCHIPAPSAKFNPPNDRPTELCRNVAGHSGPCMWEFCGEGATGDPFCDVECQRERGHTGKHRHEWGDDDE